VPEFFPNLFAPIRIGHLTLRNRICLTGHGTGMGRDFKPDDRQIAYYAERARTHDAEAFTRANASSPSWTRTAIVRSRT
jgi:2,4-dienoyl-CoA reductase-like NADH-dependent reductase (Old Yellow Enzyme family)